MRESNHPLFRFARDLPPCDLPMGNSTSKSTLSSVQLLPALYGEQGELPNVIYLASVRSSNPPYLLVVSPGGVAQFNFISGDRCLYLSSVPGAKLTCAMLLPSAINLVVGTSAGEIHFVNSSTLAIERSITTNGSPMSSFSPQPLRPTLGTWAFPPRSLSSSPPNRGSPTREFVEGNSLVTEASALAFVPPNTILVGHSDGIVRGFHMDTGKLECTLENQEPLQGQSSAVEEASLRGGDTKGGDRGGSQDAVVSMVVALSGASKYLLAVGHRTGLVAVHEVGGVAGGNGSEGCLRFPPPPHTSITPQNKGPDPLRAAGPMSALTGLVFMTSLGCIASYATGSNSVTLIDLVKGRCVLLDFTAELQSVDRWYASLSCAVWDDTRGILFVGGSDGAVYVRKLERIQGTGDVQVRLLRVAPPAVSAAAPAQVSAMLYSSKSDTLLCGDVSGIVRRLKSVSTSGVVKG